MRPSLAVLGTAATFVTCAVLACTNATTGSSGPAGASAPDAGDAASPAERPCDPALQVDAAAPAPPFGYADLTLASFGDAFLLVVHERTDFATGTFAARSWNGSAFGERVELARERRLPLPGLAIDDAGRAFLQWDGARRVFDFATASFGEEEEAPDAPAVQVVARPPGGAFVLATATDVTGPPVAAWWNPSSGKWEPTSFPDVAPLSTVKLASSRSGGAIAAIGASNLGTLSFRVSRFEAPSGDAGAATWTSPSPAREATGAKMAQIHALTAGALQNGDGIIVFSAASQASPSMPVGERGLRALYYRPGPNALDAPVTIASTETTPSEASVLVDAEDRVTVVYATPVGEKLKTFAIHRLPDGAWSLPTLLDEAAGGPPTRPRRPRVKLDARGNVGALTFGDERVLFRRRGAGDAEWSAPIDTGLRAPAAEDTSFGADFAFDAEGHVSVVVSSVGEAERRPELWMARCR